MLKGIIHSGGAKGADEIFGNFGCPNGYEVIHHSFMGHKVYGKGIVVCHLPEELQEANNLLCKVSQSIKRDYHDKNKYDLSRLQRDYFQVINSDYIIAVAPFENKEQDIVSGGTGWTVEMAKEMCKTIYLFDDTQTNIWYISKNGEKFTLFDGIVPNTGIFAGIGSNSISEIGKLEIQKILQYRNEDTEKMLQYIFDKVNDDLKFSEAKNIFIITFSSALTGIIISILKNNWSNIKDGITYAEKIWIIIVIVLLVLGCIVAIYAAIPSKLNKNAENNLLHWLGIANNMEPDVYFLKMRMDGIYH
jgi:hypothetical protein